MWPIFLKKQKMKIFQFFDQNHRLRKMQNFAPFLDLCFYSLKWLVFYLQGSKHFVLAHFTKLGRSRKFEF